MSCLYRLLWPRTIFLTLCFWEPRGVVRLALGAAFLRAVRFSFFRSSLSAILVVLATCNLIHCNLLCVPRDPGDCDHYVNRERRPDESADHIVTTSSRKETGAQSVSSVQ